MRRRVLLALLDVLPGPVGGDDLLQRGLEVACDRGVGMLVDRHARGRVGDVDESGRGAVQLAEGGLHLLRDVDQLTPTLGLHPEFTHGAYPRRRERGRVQ